MKTRTIVSSLIYSAPCREPAKSHRLASDCCATRPHGSATRSGAMAAATVKDTGFRTAPMRSR